MKNLELTKEQYVALQGIVDFATTHAADGLSPAFFNESRSLDKAKSDEEYNELYELQKNFFIELRTMLELDPLGDYAFTTSGV
jgi:hypothetical protein